MENVRGLHSIPERQGDAHGSLLRTIFREFEAIGYRVDCFVVNAVNYGAPQIRERVICIGNRFNAHAHFPAPLYSNRIEDDLPPFRTLGDAIGEGFQDPDTDCMNFSPRKLKYLALVPPGGNWRSLPPELQKEAMGKQHHLKGGRSSTWRKLSFEFPCPTIQTMPNQQPPACATQPSSGADGRRVSCRDGVSPDSAICRKHHGQDEAGRQCGAA